MLKVKNFELELDEPDHIHPPCLEFLLDDKISFLPEQGSLKWHELIQAIENNTRYCIDWSPSNGGCSIEVKDGVTSFKVAKYGDGRGGSIHVSLPSNICLDAFKEADEITKTWIK